MSELGGACEDAESDKLGNTSHRWFILSHLSQNLVYNHLLSILLVVEVPTGCGHKDLSFPAWLEYTHANKAVGRLTVDRHWQLGNRRAPF